MSQTNKIVRQLKDLRFRLFYFIFRRKSDSLERLGSPLSWVIDTRGLNEKSIIYSAGAGRDISFEEALVIKFGCNVNLHDPSPTGKETATSGQYNMNWIKFNPIGLASGSGRLSFSAPVNPEEGSFTIQRGDGSTLEFPCTTLKDLMSSNGHDHIDLLKMDIEGFEYGVIDHLLRNHLSIDQICVEYHHWTGLFSRWDTIKSVIRLHLAGYRLLHEEGWNHTFRKM
jgi:FkbM family methyltransferase